MQTNVNSESDAQNAECGRPIVLAILSVCLSVRHIVLYLLIPPNTFHPLVGHQPSFSAPTPRRYKVPVVLLLTSALYSSTEIAIYLGNGTR